MPASIEFLDSLLTTLNGITNLTHDIPVLIRSTGDAGAQRGLLERVAEEGT